MEQQADQQHDPLIEEWKALQVRAETLASQAPQNLREKLFPAIKKLTTRELQVWQQLAWGRKNSEIAEHFNISVKTVDTHRGHLLDKLASSGVRNNADLARVAVAIGVVPWGLV